MVKIYSTRNTEVGDGYVSRENLRCYLKNYMKKGNSQ